MNIPVKKTILLVEDEVILAMTEKMSLEKFGYLIITAYSGETAVETIDNTSGIDLVLMDIDLGTGIDGTEAAEKILSKHDIPIVFLSSHTDHEVVEKTEKITSYGYVVKNSSITVLDASIKMAFKLFSSIQKVNKINDKLNATFDALPDIMFELGLDGIYYDIHSSNPELIYKSNIDRIGKNIYQYIPEETANIIMSAVKEANEKGSSNGSQYDLSVPAGLRHFEVSATRMENIYDQPHFIILCRDITERKLAEERLKKSEARYHTFFEHSPISIWEEDFSELKNRLDYLRPSVGNKWREYFDSHSEQVAEMAALVKVIDINQTGVRFLNADNKKELFTNLTSYFTSDSLSMFKHELVALAEGKTHFETEISIQTPVDGEKTLFLSLSVAPDFAQTLSCVIVSFFDISERKKMELSLQTKNEEYESLNEELRASMEELHGQNEELQQVEKTLRETESRHIKMVANIGDVIVIVDRDGINRYKSPNIVKLFGWTPEELIGKSTWENIHPDDLYNLQNFIAGIMQIPNITKTTECRYLCKNSTYKWIEITVTNLLYDPVIKGFLGNYHDITERKFSQDALHKSEEKLAFVMDGVSALLTYVDTNLVFVYVNKSYAKWYGRDQKLIIGKPINDLLPQEDYNRALPFYQDVLLGNPVDFEDKRYNNEGKERFISLKLVPHFIDGKVCGFFSSIIDITDRKIAEDKILSLLEEKELLLKEVHHRIKNNMNTLYGLLVLQAGTLKDPSVIDALEDAGNRVKSMMMLYDKLYKSADFNEISTEIYLPPLIDEIATNFPNIKSVTIIKKIDSFVLNAKKLQPLGIIINELLTNIMKYAFTNRTDGIITVSLSVENKIVSLVIADDGNGMPDSVSFENSSGFGLVLVAGLTKQLNGTIRIERGQGTKIVLVFPL